MSYTHEELINYKACYVWLEENPGEENEDRNQR
jgi:hypothetical protein